MRFARLAVAFLALGLVSRASTVSANEIVLKLGTVAPEGSVWHDGLLRVRQEWREISGGEVELRIYPGGVLGGEEETIRKMQRGGLDAAALSGAGLPALHPSVNCLNVPMLLESYEELDYVRDRVAPELERRLERAGFVVLTWSDAGWVHFFTRKPARTPRDLRRMKIWISPGDPETEKLFKEFGFQVVPLPATDLLTSLQTGLVEVIDVPPLYAMLDRTYQIARHMIDVRWAPLLGATVVRKASWERVPEAYRGKLAAAVRQAGVDIRSEIRRLGADAVETMKQRGLEVVSLDAAERAEWREKAESAYPQIRGNLAPADLFDEVVRLRDEFRKGAAAAVR